MEVAANAEPGVFAQLGHVNDQRISLPVPDRVAEVHGINVLAMRTAVGRDKAHSNAALIALTDIHLIKERQQLWRLNNLPRRPYTRYPQRFAMICRIAMRLSPGQFLYFRQEFRLI